MPIRPNPPTTIHTNPIRHSNPDHTMPNTFDYPIRPNLSQSNSPHRACPIRQSKPYPTRPTRQSTPSQTDQILLRLSTPILTCPIRQPIPSHALETSQSRPNPAHLTIQTNPNQTMPNTFDNQIHAQPDIPAQSIPDQSQLPNLTHHSLPYLMDYPYQSNLSQTDNPIPTQPI